MRLPSDLRKNIRDYGLVRALLHHFGVRSVDGCVRQGGLPFGPTLWIGSLLLLVGALALLFFFRACDRFAFYERNYSPFPSDDEGGPATIILAIGVAMGAILGYPRGVQHGKKREIALPSSLYRSTVWLPFTVRQASTYLLIIIAALVTSTHVILPLIWPWDVLGLAGFLLLWSIVAGLASGFYIGDSHGRQEQFDAAQREAYQADLNQERQRQREEAQGINGDGI